MLTENGQYVEALAAMNQAVSHNPSDAQAWAFRGVLQVYLGRYEEAIASCDQALRLQPEQSEAWKFRGIALHGLNRYREAYASYDRALGVDRASPLKRIGQWIRQKLGLPDGSTSGGIDISLWDSTL